MVILPDYQGAGFGIRFLNEVGKIYKEEKFRYTIVTSAPSLIYALKKSESWRCTRYGRAKETGTGEAILRGQTSKKRITASFELK